MEFVCATGNAATQQQVGATGRRNRSAQQQVGAATGRRNDAGLDAQRRWPSFAIIPRMVNFNFSLWTRLLTGVVVLTPLDASFIQRPPIPNKSFYHVVYGYRLC